MQIILPFNACFYLHMLVRKSLHLLEIAALMHLFCLAQVQHSVVYNIVGTIISL